MDKNQVVKHMEPNSVSMFSIIDVYVWLDYLVTQIDRDSYFSYKF